VTFKTLHQIIRINDRARDLTEHIRVGLTYPSVSLNTTYSFGLDDQEFVVAFETDNISDFLDLVLTLNLKSFIADGKDLVDEIWDLRL